MAPKDDSADTNISNILSYNNKVNDHKYTSTIDWKNPFVRLSVWDFLVTRQQKRSKSINGQHQPTKPPLQKQTVKKEPFLPFVLSWVMCLCHETSPKSQLMQMQMIEKGHPPAFPNHAKMKHRHDHNNTKAFHNHSSNDPLVADLVCQQLALLFVLFRSLFPLLANVGICYVLFLIKGMSLPYIRHPHRWRSVPKMPFDGSLEMAQYHDQWCL